VRVPLAHLNAAGRVLGGVAVQSDQVGAFWIDDLRLVAAVVYQLYMPVVVTASAP
jgi:hypothetical protein